MIFLTILSWLFFAYFVYAGVSMIYQVIKERERTMAREEREFNEKIRRILEDLKNDHRAHQQTRQKQQQQKQQNVKSVVNGFSYLGLTNNASEDQVLKAYRKLSLIHHPDRGGDAIKFTNLTNAKEVCIKYLKNKSK
jgi:hypothetical protein